MDVVRETITFYSTCGRMVVVRSVTSSAVSWYVESYVNACVLNTFRLCLSYTKLLCLHGPLNEYVLSPLVGMIMSFLHE